MPNPTEHVDVDDLVRLIETLQGVIKHHDKAIGSFEYRTRMLLIDPLLNALGWDTSDPAMVNRDYHAGYGKEGYALLGRAQGARSHKPIAIIEAKQLSADIVDADRAQALINAKITGATYVGLTNGDRWEFYDVFSQSSIDDRRILSISIRYQGALNCARELLSAFLRLTESTGGPTVESARRRSRTYYDELDVEPSASSTDIRKAFLRRVKQIHPDVSKRSQANQETARLNQVYAILSNQQLRREYDAIILPPAPDTNTPPTVEREPRAETTSRKTGPARSRRGSAQSSTGSQQSGPGPRQSRKRSRQWQARRNFSFWRNARWLAARLLVIAILITAAVIGYHWYSGAPLGAAVEMMTEDYRLAAACPTETETVFGFLRRAPSPDNYSGMSARYPEGWEAQVCNGNLAYDQSPDIAKANQPAQTVAPIATEGPTPDAQTTATPKPTIRPTVEAPIRRIVAIPRPTLPPTYAPIPPPMLPPAATAIPAITLKLASSPTVALLPTIAPVATVAFLPTLAPVPTVALLSTIALRATVAPVPAAALLPTVPPTPIPIPPPPLRHIEEKLHMLELINDKRVSVGLNPIVLGDNAAAQLHAEASLENCFSSHWGIDGLKPYMRYSLAGGFQSNGENGSGSDYCIQASDGYRANGSAEQEIRQAMEGWMESPGHRDNILDPWHKKVNIGLAWDRYNLMAYQHFEGDYVEYDQLPNIERGVLTMSGTVKNGVRFNDDFRDLSVQVYYDRPPHTLTRGQVARTYCYDNGLPVAALRPPLTGRSFYPRNEFSQTHNPCPNPYDVPADADAPRSHDAAHLIWLSAYRDSLARQAQIITVPWITALEWSVKGESFSITADLSDVLEKHGNGVYSLVVWGNIEGENIVISEYSIFHDVTPPGTYNAHDAEGP